jgi:phage terminase Nu1 subunit (DNA packaging protein)
MSSSNNKLEDIETLTVSSEVMGKLLNVTSRRIRQYAEEGVIEKAARGRYALYPSVQKYIAFLKTKNDIDELEEDEELNYDKEKAIHEMIKRKIAEINLAKIQGQVHESEDVKHVMENMLANFRTKLMTMPSKLAPILIARDNIPVIQSLIDKEVIEALEELSEYSPEMFLSDEYISLDDEDEEEVWDDDDEDSEEDS